jgi:hypothetical protein
MMRRLLKSWNWKEKFVHEVPKIWNVYITSRFWIFQQALTYIKNLGVCEGAWFGV